ncbi:MAG: DUF3810 family protein [Oscillospiraceae bacterium]|nr:DUF3810 family protein [Oscillospiraceae bacterium]
MKNNKLYWRIIIVVSVLSVILNFAACFRKFCDVYTKVIYMKITDILGWLFGLFPVAAGEILMYAAGIIIAAAFIILIILIFLRKKSGFRKFAASYMKSVLMILVCVVFIYTVNWIIPLRTTPLSPGTEEKRSYTVEELRILRKYIVESTNKLCDEVPRDENGTLLIPDQLDEDIIKAMKNVSDELPLLDGYYPHPKAALCSGVLSWMNIGGYTYPYTKEIQYNKYDTRLSYPSLIAHEYSHYRGYFRENEGEFAGFLACASSENPLIRYSGFIQVFHYVDNAFFDSLENSCSEEEYIFELVNAEYLYQEVWDDIDNSISEADELYENEVSDFAENTFSPIAEEAADTGWSTQKKILKEASYDGVTELLLQYYDGILY